MNIRGRSGRNKGLDEAKGTDEKKGLSSGGRVEPETLQECLERRRTGPQQYTIALCLLFSTSSSFRFRADSVSDLELLAEVVSSFNSTAVLLAESSILPLELFVAACTCADPLAVLPVRLLHWEPVRSRSASESSRLWLSSELESWTARLSEVLLLGVGELVVGVAAHTGGGCAAAFTGTGFTVCVTTVAVVVTVVDCATLVR